MRKFIFLTAILLITLVGYTQTKTVIKSGSKNTIATVADAASADSAQYLPDGCGYPTLNVLPYMNSKSGTLIYKDVCNNIVYTYSPSQGWSPIQTTTSGMVKNGLIQPGYVTWSGTGLTFNVTGAIYSINNITYTSIPGSITLNASDNIYARYDVIAVDTNGNIVKVTGTPGVNPVVPQVNPESQVLLTTIYVAAGATTPVNLNQTIIYDENNEWTGVASSGLTANLNNTVSVYHLSKSIDIGSWTNSKNLIFTKGSGTENRNNYSIINLYVNLKVAITGSIKITFFNGGTAVSNIVDVTTAFGLNKSTINTFQNIIIPLTAFNFNSNIFNKIRVSFNGNGSGLYLDYLQLQGGVFTGSNNSWLINGNSNTDSSTNFIGTPDAKPLSVRTNNIERLRIGSNGNIIVNVDSSDANTNNVAWFDSNNILHRGHLTSGTSNNNPDSLGGYAATDYALNSNVVHITGNETVGGDKTFTGDLYFGGTTTFNGLSNGLVKSTSGVLSNSTGTGFVKMNGSSISFDNSTYLTTTLAASTYVPLTRTVNGKGLSSDIILSLASSDFQNQGSTTTVLHGNASGNPSFSSVSLSADVSGILPFNNGGFGFNTATNGDILYYNGGWQKLSAGSSGTILGMQNGLPFWNSAIFVDTATRVIYKNNLLNTTRPAISLLDTTAATSGSNTYWSPALLFRGQAYPINTNQKVFYRNYLYTSYGEYQMKWDWSTDSVTWNNGFYYRQSNGSLNASIFQGSQAIVQSVFTQGLDAAVVIADANSNISSNTSNTTSVQMLGANIQKTGGIYRGVYITPIYNETSGNALNYDLVVNRTENNLSSGLQRLFSLQVAGTEKFGVDNIGKIKTSYGNGTKTGTAAYNLSVTSSGDLIETALPSVNGNIDLSTTTLPSPASGHVVIWFDGTYLKVTKNVSGTTYTAVIY